MVAKRNLECFAFPRISFLQKRPDIEGCDQARHHQEPRLRWAEAWRGLQTQPERQGTGFLMVRMMARKSVP